MNKRIEVYYKSDMHDPIGNRMKGEAETMGYDNISSIRTADVYLVDSRLTDAEIEKICRQLLVDSVTQEFSIRDYGQPDAGSGHAGSGCTGSGHAGSGCTGSGHAGSGCADSCRIIEISRKPGVMDVAEASILRGVGDMGLAVNSIERVKRYVISGKLTDDQCKTIANKLLSNATIERASIDAGAVSTRNPGSNNQNPNKGDQVSFRVNAVNLADKDDNELVEISREWQLSLNEDEMRAIQKHFTALKRSPTDIELETIAQTWSEHCIHKTLKGVIEFNGKIIDNLLGSTIMAATARLNKPWCVSVFKDNAGIIEFVNGYNICFKVETHNHPSAIEPYGGSCTGIGGVIRDILGTGLGGKPVLNTDVFCFGLPDTPQEDVPDGALHPKRILRGVVNGVRDYGNRMGIPTLNGSLFFDARYTGNPLVFCGTAGIIPADRCRKEPKRGDLIVLAGGRTGLDGIHGVTFASIGLDKESEADSGSAVQIGNPIVEKKLTEALLTARDRGIYNCVTDCGGGGLSSAIGEMGEELGAEVYLDKVPLKYTGLSYADIWISEAQERMIFSVPAEHEDEFIAIFNGEEVEAATIGRFTGDKTLHLLFHNKTVGRMDMEFLHNGLPRLTRRAEWKPTRFAEPKTGELEEKGATGSNQPETLNSVSNPQSPYGRDLKRILASWNVCSKESIIREYDHEVQGASVLKPLVGVNNDGPGDASIIKPLNGSNSGIIVSNGMNPRYGDIDPYHMAASAIDEALRQIIAVGGNLERVALIDNFCWGDTERAECLGSLVRAAQACHDYSLWYETPFVSGKDSLYNEFDNGSVTISIPPSLLISAIAVMPDVTKAVSMDVKKAGNLIYAVGLTKAELGGSHYYLIHEYIGNRAPEVDAVSGRRTMNALSMATDRRLVESCHDCSEGGIAVAAAEMSFAGGLGMDINLANVPVDNNTIPDGTILFSESNGRFLVEIEPNNRRAFESIMDGITCGLIGKVTDSDRLVILGGNEAVILSEDINDLKERWQGRL